MERDPDYIDPKILRRRAAEQGDAGVQSSRPRFHVTDDDEPERSGILLRGGQRYTGARVVGVGNPLAAPTLR